LVGNPWNAAVSVLNHEYKEDETRLQDALDQSIKVGSLHKTMDMTKLTSEKIELVALTREYGKTQIKIFPADQADLRQEDDDDEGEEPNQRRRNKE